MTKFPKFNPNKASAVVLAIVAVIVLAAIAGGVYLIIKKAIEKEERAEEEEELLSEEQDEFANWKTYRNEEYGWEIHHPEDWAISENPQYYKQVSLKLYGAGDFDKVTIWIEDNPKNLDEVDWLREKESDRYSMLMNQAEDIKIDTETGLLIKDQPEMVSYRVVYVSKNKKMHIMSIAKDSSYVKIFNQILSTFKFLEPDEFADWKTYLHPAYRVKYPADWTLTSYSQEEVGFFEPGSKLGKEHRGDIFIKIIENLEKLTIDEYIKTKPPIVTDRGDITVSRITARQIIESGMLEFRTTIISLGDDHFIEISERMNYQEERDRIYSQVLSSFEIVN